MHGRPRGCYRPPPVSTLDAVSLPLPFALPLDEARTAPLPLLDVTPDWKDQRRLWGHSFHPMCSYLGSFPAPLAHAFISRLSRPGDVVLDPFSGRGTAPLQACATRRIGAGIDANPLAFVLTGAKVDPPSRLEVETRLSELRLGWITESVDWLTVAKAGPTALIERRRGGFEGLPIEVVSAFHPGALAEVLYLRRWLMLDDRTDRFLAAALLGILHGRSSGYVSDAMPNGFSLAPGYVARDMAARHVPTAHRDVIALLAAKVRRLFRDGAPRTRGVALHGDARDAGPQLRHALASRGLPDRARLVVTSPPYLRTLRYGAANWLRLWFLGEDPAAVDRALDAPPSPEALATFLRDVLGGLRDALTDDAAVALVIGDVATDRGKKRAGEHGLTTQIWETAAEPLGYRLAGVIADPVAANRKLTRLWGAEAGRATDTDRILVLGATELGRRRALASLATPVDWTWPPRQSAAFQPILGRDAADVPPGRPRDHGPARAYEEPRSRADDLAPALIRAPAADAPVPA